MIQGEDESLEYYEERFQLNDKTNAIYTLDKESLKLVLLKGVRKEWMETMNLLVNGHIFQLPYDDIKQFFKNFPSTTSKNNRGHRGTIAQSSKGTIIGLTKSEIKNLLQDMKMLRGLNSL
jgi:hypothetical protein